MAEMPPDPFAGDFLPMAQNSKLMFDAAITAGFTEAQAMQWVIGITVSIINANIKVR